MGARKSGGGLNLDHELSDGDAVAPVLMWSKGGDRGQYRIRSSQELLDG
jgi:hypothetical protein